MRKLRIRNGNVYTETEGFICKPLWIIGERIVSEEDYDEIPYPEEVFDAEGAYLIPGLTDIHFHGCMGYDCCDASQEAIDAMARYELQCGVTAVTPATMTICEEQLARICKEAAGREQYRPGMADFCGLYMEGPFINPGKKGAQKESDILKPDPDLFRRLQTLAGGCIKTLIIAPEMTGAQEMIRELSGEVRISLGHTAADYDTAVTAFRHGAQQLSHMYNAMPALLHRAPGPVGAGAHTPGVMADLICDGVHVHPAAVRAAFRLYGGERIIMISDSMRATGLPDGLSELGGQEVRKRGKIAELKDGTLAGSVTNLMECLRTAVREMDIALTQAVRAAAVNPAKAVGIYGDYGRLEPGSYANIAVLGENLELEEVFHRGKQILRDPSAEKQQQKKR